MIEKGLDVDDFAEDENEDESEDDSNSSDSRTYTKSHTKGKDDDLVKSTPTTLHMLNKTGNTV